MWQSQGQASGIELRSEGASGGTSRYMLPPMGYRLASTGGQAHPVWGTVALGTTAELSPYPGRAGGSCGEESKLHRGAVLGRPPNDPGTSERQEGVKLRADMPCQC